MTHPVLGPISYKSSDWGCRVYAPYKQFGDYWIHMLLDLIVRRMHIQKYNLLCNWTGWNVVDCKYEPRICCIIMWNCGYSCGWMLMKNLPQSVKSVLYSHWIQINRRWTCHRLLHIFDSRYIKLYEQSIKILNCSILSWRHDIETFFAHAVLIDIR